MKLCMFFFLFLFFVIKMLIPYILKAAVICCIHAVIIKISLHGLLKVFWAFDTRQNAEMSLKQLISISLHSTLK